MMVYAIVNKTNLIHDFHLNTEIPMEIVNSRRSHTLDCISPSGVINQQISFENIIVCG